MKAIFATLSIAAGAAWAQTALTAPQAGFMQDASNSVRPVYGIAGSFLLGEPVCSGVLSAAFSGSFGLVKTASAVALLDSSGAIVTSIDAPDGPALFAFARSGAPALAYLTATNTLLSWSDGSFAAVPFDVTTLAAAPVVAVGAPDSDHAAMILQRDDGLWEIRVRLSTGEIDAQAAIPGVIAPVLMLAGGALVYADANGMVVRKRDGTERHIGVPMPASVALEPMGDGWIQLRDLASGQQFAIRMAENREQSYQLPEVDQ